MQVLLLLVLIALSAIVIIGVKGRIDDEHPNKMVLLFDASEIKLLRFTWLQVQIMKEFQEMYGTEFNWVMDKLYADDLEGLDRKEMTIEQFKKDIEKIQSKFDGLANIIMGINIAVIVICVIYLLLQIA